jgi:hypothetical protein
MNVTDEEKVFLFATLEAVSEAEDRHSRAQQTHPHTITFSRQFSEAEK